jgi:hypothetical protein
MPVVAPQRDGEVRPDATEELHRRWMQALDALLQQIRRQRVSHVVAPPGRPRPLQQGELLSLLSLLQAMPAQTLRLIGIGHAEPLSQRLRRELLSSVSLLGLDPVEVCLQSSDADVLDLVALLFEALLGQRELDGNARTLLARLLLPYAKVALLDRALFVQRSHPARRLLDLLIEACETGAAETVAERALIAKVEETVERLVAEFNDNLLIFKRLADEFHGILDKHQRRVEIAERRAAETQRGQERLELARDRARAELRHRAAAGGLPQSIEIFLDQPWRHHLVMVILRESVEGRCVGDGAALLRALALADRMLEELAQARRGVRSGTWLLSALPALNEVFTSIGVYGESAHAQVEKLQQDLQAISEGRVPRPVASSSMPPMDLPPSPATGEHMLINVPELVQGEQIDTAEVDHFRGLAIGTWLDFTDDAGKLLAGKLSWVSPSSARLLFVNRRGARVCVVLAEQLAVMFRQGLLHWRVDATAFERAMLGVIDNIYPVTVE